MVAFPSRSQVQITKDALFDYSFYWLNTVEYTTNNIMASHNLIMIIIKVYYVHDHLKY